MSEMLVPPKAGVAAGIRVSDGRKGLPPVFVVGSEYGCCPHRSIDLTALARLSALLTAVVMVAVVSARDFTLRVMCARVCSSICPTNQVPAKTRTAPRMM